MTDRFQIRPRGAYFGSVDLIRLFAAGLVMFYHLGWQIWQADARGARAILKMPPLSRPPISALSVGWVGVEIFFVISGLVIANSAAKSTPGGFLKYRLYRLYPTAWICGSISALIYIYFGFTDHLLGDYLRSMTLSVNGPWMSGVYWTLAIEIVFYASVLAWKLIFPTVALEHLAAALLGSSAAYYAFALALGGGFQSLAEDIPIIRYAMYFALGMYIWLTTQRRLKPAEMLLLATSFILSAAVLYRSSQGRILAVLFWSLAVCVIAISTHTPAHFSPKADKAQNFIRTVGLMTYPIYLLHYPVGAGTMRTLLAWGASFWEATSAATLAVLTVSYLVAAHLEPPMRQMLRTVVERLVTRCHRVFAP